ncbi:MAG: DUF5702 domain-containing protein [Lachnospiraceae bacterium]|nr:DUF5702 domain-containing protein [Lachnospiraceae bacterium]
MRKGSLTVFLSLTIAIMLSLILALLQNARIGAVRMKTECATDISMNSVLAEYNRALYEQYDLLLTDLSYQTDSPSVANAEEHLRYFLQGNFDRSVIGRLTGTRTMTATECEDVTISAYSVATDNGGAVLRRQILAYMEGEPVMDAIAEAGANLGVLSSHGFDTRDVEAEAAENRAQLEAIEIPTQIDEEGNEYQPILDNPADAVESQKGVGIVNLAVPDPSSISTVSVDLSRYVSHREKNRGTGLDEEESLSVIDRMLINQYMVEKTGCFTRPKEGSLLKYQLEYLIAGQNSDFENLESCARAIMFWREATNLVCLLSDNSKVAMVEALAGVLSALVFVPELQEPLKWSMIFAWSFAESVSDMRILYEGGRVPLVKTQDTWRLSFTNLAFFRDHLGGGGDSGLEYADYLRMLLLLQGMDEKTDRLADLMEMDVRQTPGNANFMLDWCMDVFQAEMLITSRVGFSMRIVRIYGYEK